MYELHVHPHRQSRTHDTTHPHTSLPSFPHRRLGSTLSHKHTHQHAQRKSDKEAQAALMELYVRKIYKMHRIKSVDAFTSLDGNGELGGHGAERGRHKPTTTPSLLSLLLLILLYQRTPTKGRTTA